MLESLARAGEPAAAAQYVAPAVRGFFRSVALGQAGGDRTGGLQDILRLLTLWFNWGSAPAVEGALQEGFGLVSVDTWLAVIPQVIARIHAADGAVRALIHQLLVRIGRHHPQALMYPLLVACKSQSQARRAAAYAVLDVIRTHSAALVEQAQLVSQELIRIAILWHEEWHEALEEASRLYFGESNVEAMLGVLLPLHERMERQGPTTLKEIAFVQVGLDWVGVLEEGGVVCFLFWACPVVVRLLAPDPFLNNNPNRNDAKHHHQLPTSTRTPTTNQHQHNQHTNPNTINHHQHHTGLRPRALRGVRVAVQVPRVAQGGRAAPGVGPLLPRLQARQQAAARADEPGAAVRRAGARARAGERMESGEWRLETGESREWRENCVFCVLCRRSWPGCCKW